MKRLLLFLPLAGLALAGTEVELKTETGVLHGTLEEAAKPDKSVVVLILPGSGPTDRDGNSAGLPGKNNCLKQLAEVLTAKGISSLRIDKRGIAASAAAGPKEEDLRFETYIDDAEAWIDFLEKDKGFKKTVVLGHSEGALIGLVAAEKKDVAGYISLAGTSRRAGPLLRAQLKSKLTPALLGEATVVMQLLDQGEQVEKISPELNVLFRPSVQPYLISWFKYTPTEEIGNLKAPALILQGSTDIQVLPADAEALHAAQPDSTLEIIDGMNHVLKAVSSDEKAQLDSYSNPKLELHPGLVGPIEKFVREQAKAGSP